MTNQRRAAFAVLAVLVVTFGCASFIGFETSALTEGSTRAEATTAALVRGESSPAAQSPSAQEAQADGGAVAASASSTRNTAQTPTEPDATDARSPVVSSAPSTPPTHSSTAADTPDAAATDKPHTGAAASQSGGNGQPSTSQAKATDGKTSLRREGDADGDADVGPDADADVDHDADDNADADSDADKNRDAASDNTDTRGETDGKHTTTGATKNARADETQPEQQGNNKKETEAPRARPLAAEFDLEELMTPELIAEIESRENDCLSPMHVHLLWIGDVENAPRERLRYTELGYNLTVHTSAEEILAGFHPYVLKAYKLALPRVVGFDFLKFALLYKYGGLAVDADTTPSIPAASLHFPPDCDVVFGKEAQLRQWQRPIFREQGGNTYGLNRPFQILNWAMAAAAPRNEHIRWLMKVAMAHFFGLRDMEMSLVQDISGSGIMSDYVALLHERAGRSYPEVYRDETKYVPVEGLCLTDGYLHGGWIRHLFHGTWKVHGAQ